RDFVVRRLADGIDRTDFVRILLAWPDAREHMVTEAYQQVLGRAPDPAGLSYWSTCCRTRAELVASLLASPEAYRQAGSTPEGYVTKVYETLLGRSANSPGSGYWAERLAAGTSRRSVAASVYASTESRRLRAAEGYRTLLRR